MLKEDLDDAIAEAHRFIIKAEKLKGCTMSSELDGPSHYRMFGFDQGLNGNIAPSKTRAAVKRSAIDLKNELSKLNKGNPYA